MAKNVVFYPLVGFVSCITFIYLSLGGWRWFSFVEGPDKMEEFVRREGTHFMVGGKEVYVNGWNSFWLMDQAVEEYSRHRVKKMLEAGGKMGLTVCRTWAFRDGGYHALQLSPGRFDERVFKALDGVIAEARIHGIRLILGLVNNLDAYGGKSQYVKWAEEDRMTSLPSNDSFFSDPFMRSYFRNYIQAILTRKNILTGLEYRNDPTIFAWELINEPRCTSDPSGDTLQDWLVEMTEFVKSIDKNHMLTVGLEGFYGPKTTERLQVNPGDWASTVGVDFIRNSMISTVDFASVHVYPDDWILYSTFEEKMEFAKTWVSAHIEDSDQVLGKPVLFTEFGLSSETITFQPHQRDLYYKQIYDLIYDLIYESALGNRSGAGSMAWQFLSDGMDELGDVFAVVPWQLPSLYKMVMEHSCQLRSIHMGRVSSDSTISCSYK